MDSDSSPYSPYVMPSDVVISRFFPFLHYLLTSGLPIAAVDS